MGSMSIWHWIIVLVIVALIFGTKKLRNFGEDIGAAVKSFRKGMQDGNENAGSPQLKADPLQPTPPASSDNKPESNSTNSAP